MLWETLTNSYPDDGIKIHPHPDAHLDLLAETRHFLYVGKSGGGKTQSMMHALLSAIERGDRVVINDTKGDFSRLFSIEDYKSKHVVLLNPQDQRCMNSTYHALCKDVVKRTDPELLAANLIKVPEAQADFWSKSGKDILAGVIAALNAEMPNGWSWKDFATMFSVAKTGKMAGKPVLLIKAIQEHRPAAFTHLGAPEQAAGVISNIRVDTTFLDHLGYYWPRRKEGFSIRSWVNGTAHKNTQILIFKSLPTEEYYSGALATQVSLALSEAIALPDGDARLWFFLDELPQLPKINLLKKSMEMLRSKGVRMVLGMQGNSSIKGTYGEEDTVTIIEQIDSFFVGKCVGETAEWVSNLFGKTVQERFQKTLSANTNMQTVIDPSQQSSDSWQRQEVSALPAGEIATLPDSIKPTWFQEKILRKKGGPTLYVKVPGLGNKILKLFYPYMHVENKCESNYPRLDKHIKHDPKPVTVKKSSGGGVISKADAWLKAYAKSKEQGNSVTAEDTKPIQRPIKTSKDKPKHGGSDAVKQPVKPIEPEKEKSVDGGEDPVAETMHEAIDQASEAMVGVNLGTVFDAAEMMIMDTQTQGQKQTVQPGAITSSDSSEEKKKKVKAALKKLSGGKR